MLAQVGLFQTLRTYRTEEGLLCGSFVREGEVFAYVGLFQNLKDLNDDLRKGEVFGPHDALLGSRSFRTWRVT